MKLFLISTLFVIITFILALTIGLFEIPDAYFYYVLGHKLLTGELIPVAPLNGDIPQSLFGPVYAILSYIFISIPPGPQFYLPFIQLIMIGISSLCVYFSSKNLISKRFRFFIPIIFLLMPFNILYAFAYMSETTTLFFVSLSVYVFFRTKNSLIKFSILTGLSSLLALTRFAFIPWTFITYTSLGITLLFHFKNKIRLKKSELSSFIIPILAATLLLIWLQLNHQWYGAWIMSTFTGRHAYNNVITAGKFIPKDTTSNAIKTFLQYIPPGTDLKKPWWDILPHFSQPFYEKKLTEIEIDKLFLSFALQGIKENIGQYILHVINLAIITPNTPPYYDNVLTQLGFSEPACPICSVKQCRFNWMPQFCKPIKENTTFLKIFGNLIIFTKNLYPFLTFSIMLTVIAGSFRIVFKRKITYTIFVVIFYFQHFFQSSSEWVEGRFLIPLYPFYTILFLEGLILIIILAKNLKKKLEYSMVK